MQTTMQLHRSEGGQTLISLSVPVDQAIKVADAVSSLLNLSGHEVRHLDADGEEYVSADEAFPIVTPAMVLKGYRGKMEWTQKELAEKLGTTQNCISAMENGRRPISPSMARRMGELFDISYRVFL